MVFALLVALSSIAGAVYIMADQYVQKATTQNGNGDPETNLFPGVGVLLQVRSESQFGW